MTNLNIEDYLHLVQGADNKVKLRGVECLKVSTASDYLNTNKALIEPSSSILISSEIVLAYEVGFDITINMDTCYEGISVPIADADSLIEIIKNRDYKLTLPLNRTPSESHLFEVKNKEVMNQLKIIYGNIRDLSCRDNFAWVVNERKAALIMEEYKMALAIKPYSQWRYFEENMLTALHERIIEKAVQLIRP